MFLRADTAWRAAPTTAHDQRDDDLTDEIATIFERSRHTYGSNRVEEALRDDAPLPMR